MNAVKGGDLNIVKAILNASSYIDINCKSNQDDGNSLLHLAVKHGHRDIFDFLCIYRGKIAGKSLEY